jgi:hypothetical protein
MSAPRWSRVPCGSPFVAPGPLGLDLEGNFKLAASLELSAGVRPEPLHVDTVQKAVQKDRASFC